MEGNELDSFCINSARLPSTVDTSPYSFENAYTIEKMLAASGFQNIVIDTPDALIAAGNAASTLKIVTRVGTLEKTLRKNQNLLPVSEPIMHSALAAREQNGLVHLGSATWIVTAMA